MERYGIRTQVWFGFGTILGLVVVLAVTCFVAASYMGGIFSEYRQTSRQSVALGDFVEDLFEARMNALKYRIQASPKNAEAVVSNIAEIQRDAVQKTDLFSGKEDLLVKLNQLAEKADQYRNGFERMTDLQAEREVIVTRISSVGPRSRKQLTDVMESAYRDSDVTAAYYAGVAQKSLMLGRFYTERYLLTNAEDALGQARQYLGEAVKDSRTLLGELQNPKRRQLATAAIKDIQTYAASLEELSKVISSRNDIRTNVLDKIGPEKQTELENILESIVAYQNEIGPAGSSAVSNILIFILITSIVSIGIGAFLAFFIARALTGNVNRLADDMDRLANDDLDVQITGDEHEHELGRMARALGVFKENAIRIRSTAQEKETTRKALADSLSLVVDAASVGDFSQRMAPQFDDGTPNPFAAGINEMLSIVEDGLKQTNQVLQKLADGDLTERMRGNHLGAFAKLQSSMNATMERLSDLISQIVNESLTIQQKVQVIENSANSLSGRTEQQAASLEETASTMEQMSTTIDTNAKNSSDAQILAQNASDQAKKGGDVVQGAVAAMSKIEKGASQITEIITVIEGLAFQTNLLALNTAVEAARAGEAGKGFAVVASEVRSLAQRSAESARDISQLIESSNEQVEEGSSLVRKAGEALVDIVNAIQNVEDSVESIANASREQSSGVAEISSAIGQMDGLTQENAAMAEESASNSHSLSARAEKLRELVAFFQMEKRAAA